MATNSRAKLIYFLGVLIYSSGTPNHLRGDGVSTPRATCCFGTCCTAVVQGCLCHDSWNCVFAGVWGLGLGLPYRGQPLSLRRTCLVRGLSSHLSVVDPQSSGVVVQHVQYPCVNGRMQDSQHVHGTPKDPPPSEQPEGNHVLNTGPSLCLGRSTLRWGDSLGLIDSLHTLDFPRLGATLSAGHPQV